MDKKINWTDKSLRLKITVPLFFIGLVLEFGFKSNVANYLYIIIWIIAGYDVVAEALEQVLSSQLMAEQFLMSLATIGALAIFEFREAAMVMVLYQIGEELSDRAVDKAEDSVAALMDIKAPIAHLWENSKGVDIDPDQLKIGDKIVIRAGEKIPVDCTVFEGRSHIDMKALTGESMPVSVDIGDPLLSGSVNGSGRLLAMVDKLAEDSSASRMIALMKEAEENKSQAESFVRKFAKIYTPIVTAAALAMALVIPLILTGGLSTLWLKKALNFLIVSCPCAFVISVPLSFVSGMGACSKRGVLVKGGAAMEAMNQVKTLAMDKTGTLTEGQLKLQPYHPAEGVDPLETFKLIVAAEEGSTHPIAEAVRTYARETMPLALTDPIHFDKTLDRPGLGLEAWTGHKHLALGTRAFMDELGFSNDITDDECQNMPATIVHVAMLEPEKKYLAHFLLADRVKEEAPLALKNIRKYGVEKFVMLTGDRDNIAKEIAGELGIDDYRAGLLPQDKIKAVEELQSKSCLAFVGDGLNDAPVLAKADVGLAMGISGSDAAIKAADAVLMNDKLSSLVEAFRLSRYTVSVAKQNIFFALATKFIILAASVLLDIPMGLAVFGDVGVTLICVMNALRLLF